MDFCIIREDRGDDSILLEQNSLVIPGGQPKRIADAVMRLSVTYQGSASIAQFLIKIPFIETSVE